MTIKRLTKPPILILLGIPLQILLSIRNPGPRNLQTEGPQNEHPHMPQKPEESKPKFSLVIIIGGQKHELKMRENGKGMRDAKKRISWEGK